MKKRIMALIMAFTMLLSLFGTTVFAEEAADAKTEEIWGGESGEVCGDENGEYTIGVIIHTTTDYLCSKLKAYTDYLGKSSLCTGSRRNYYH